MAYERKAITACAFLLILVGAAAAMESFTLDAGAGAWMIESGTAYWRKDDLLKEETVIAPTAAVSIRAGWSRLALEGSLHYFSYPGHYNTSVVGMYNRIPVYLIPTPLFTVYFGPNFGFGHGWYPAVTPASVTGSEYISFGIDAGLKLPLPPPISYADVCYSHQRIKDNQAQTYGSSYRRQYRGKINISLSDKCGIAVEAGTLDEECIMRDDTAAEGISYYTKTLKPASPYVRIGPSYTF